MVRLELDRPLARGAIQVCHLSCEKSDWNDLRFLNLAGGQGGAYPSGGISSVTHPGQVISTGLPAGSQYLPNGQILLPNGQVIPGPGK